MREKHVVTVVIAAQTFDLQVLSTLQQILAILAGLHVHVLYLFNKKCSNCTTIRQNAEA